MTYSINVDFPDLLELLQQSVTNDFSFKQQFFVTWSQPYIELSLPGRGACTQKQHLTVQQGVDYDSIMKAVADVEGNGVF